MLYNGFRFVLGYRNWPMYHLEHPMASALLDLGVLYLPASAHYLTINSPYGTDSSLNKLLLPPSAIYCNVDYIVPNEYRLHEIYFSQDMPGHHGIHRMPSSDQGHLCQSVQHRASNLSTQWLFPRVPMLSRNLPEQRNVCSCRDVLLLISRTTLQSARCCEDWMQHMVRIAMYLKLTHFPRKRHLNYIISAYSMKAVLFTNELYTEVTYGPMKISKG